MSILETEDGKAYTIFAGVYITVEYLDHVEDIPNKITHLTLFRVTGNEEVIQLDGQAGFTRLASDSEGDVNYYTDLDVPIDPDSMLSVHI